jgi:hypothetical protein
MWSKLFWFLHPGATEPDPDPPVDDPPPDDTLPDDDAIPPEDSTPDVPPSDEPPRSRASDTIRDLRSRAQAAEEQYRRLEAEINALKSTQPRVDPEVEEEERKLRNPETPELERWQITANRRIRTAEANSRMQLISALDLADKASFDRVTIRDGNAEKYRDRVESHLQEMRKSGRNPPREEVYHYLLGRDVAKANFERASKAKPKTATTTTSSVPANARTPRTPVTSDVGRHKVNTEHEKRRARLDGQII